MGEETLLRALRRLHDLIDWLLVKDLSSGVNERGAFRFLGGAKGAGRDHAA